MTDTPPAAGILLCRYNTLDLTPFLPAGGGPAVLALQTMQFSGFDPNTGTYPFPCAAGVQCNGPTQISKGMRGRAPGRRTAGTRVLPGRGFAVHCATTVQSPF